MNYAEYIRLETPYYQIRNKEQIIEFLDLKRKTEVEKSR